MLSFQLNRSQMVRIWQLGGVMAALGVANLFSFNRQGRVSDEFVKRVLDDLLNGSYRVPELTAGKLYYFTTGLGMTDMTEADLERYEDYRPDKRLEIVALYRGLKDAPATECLPVDAMRLLCMSNSASLTDDYDKLGELLNAGYTLDDLFEASDRGFTPTALTAKLLPVTDREAQLTALAKAVAKRERNGQYGQRKECYDEDLESLMKAHPDANREQVIAWLRSEESPAVIHEVLERRLDLLGARRLFALRMGAGVLDEALVERFMALPGFNGDVEMAECFVAAAVKDKQVALADIESMLLLPQIVWQGKGTPPGFWIRYVRAFMTWALFCNIVEQDGWWGEQEISLQTGEIFKEYVARSRRKSRTLFPLPPFMARQVQALAAAK